MNVRTVPLFSMYCCRNKAAGFTLIELLVTIVIAGILAALAVPSFQSFVAEQRVKTAAFDVMSMLTLARSEALKRNANVIAAQAAGGWQNGWTVSSNGTALSQQSSLRGLSIVCKSGGAVTACPASITYNNNGRISSVAALPSFEITGSGSTSLRCIGIDLSGRPYSKQGGC